jgi:FeS assembly protein IscX
VDNEIGGPLTWDDTYAIAQALIQLHPNVNLESVSLSMIYKWTIALPDFRDDPELSNDDILSAIYQEWYEEVNPL